MIGTVVCLIVALTWFSVYLYQSPERAAGHLLRDQMAQEATVQSYQIKDSTWTVSCCSQSKLTDYRRADAVRYRVEVKLQSGQVEEWMVDLLDQRDGLAQADTEFSYWGGGQQWQFNQIYKPGQEPPAIIWAN